MVILTKVLIYKDKEPNSSICIHFIFCNEKLDNEGSHADKE